MSFLQIILSGRVFVLSFRGNMAGFFALCFIGTDTLALNCRKPKYLIHYEGVSVRRARVAALRAFATWLALAFLRAVAI